MAKLSREQEYAMQKAKEWVADAQIETNDKEEIIELIETQNIKEITERFYKDLEFGTGGMRSILGMGTNRINRYTIRRASHALSLALKEYAPNLSQSIAISYDSRKLSYELAKEAACVFAANGIKALLFKRLNPVPLLSYAIRHHKTGAGVMVTASHNPASYNGFKVFWSNGAQVTPPQDQEIIDHYYATNSLSEIKFINFEEAEEKGLIEWLDEETENHYHNAINQSIIRKQMCKEDGEKLKVIYTPLHGTGLIPCSRALKEVGLTNFKVVLDQANPDHRFPTVKSPNPENPEALEMAVDLMKKHQADIVMGSDPDTDRLGVAFIDYKKDPEKVYFLNGNQIGIILLHYILKSKKELGELPAKSFFVKTIVTTNLQSQIAKSYGVDAENTLTGFKWICRRVDEVLKAAPEKTFLFGTEESFGYLNHEHIRDKDGVSSLALMAEVALYYKLQNKSLNDALDEIYEEHGFSGEYLLNLNYDGKEGSEKILRIMDFFRNYKESSFAGERIDKIEDYKQLTIISKSDDRSEKIEGIPQSNVLGFIFEDQSKVYVRPSGTEPKIKFYIMVQENEGLLADKKVKAQKRIDQILNFINKTVENI